MTVFNEVHNSTLFTSVGTVSIKTRSKNEKQKTTKKNKTHRRKY